MNQINALFEELEKSGWLNTEECERFKTDKNIVKCIESCTSPQIPNIFNSLKTTSIDKVKAVILGKDPYPNPKDAHGLAFSSLDKSTPDSLKNIFKAIDKAYNSHLFEQGHNDLTNWAKSGVLMLNTGLTYKRIEDNTLSKKEKDLLQAKTQNEHMKIWKPFVKLIIKKILGIKDRPIAMLLWGNDAHNIVFGNIDNKDFKQYLHTREAVIIPDTKIMLLQASHPSPLSVNRGGDFLSVVPEHFKICDKHTNYKINWISL